MSLAPLLAEYAESDAGVRRVQLLPGAHEIARLVPDAVAVPTPTADGVPSLLIERYRDSDPTGRIAELVAVLDDHDVLCALVDWPASLPVGPLVQVVTDAGARIVRAEAMEAPLSGTLLALTRDPSVPRTSFLLGHALPDSDAFAARVANEWLVEGLVLRARVARADRDVARLETELGRSREAAGQLRTQLQEARDELSTARRRLRRVRRENDELRAQASATVWQRARRRMGAGPQ